MADPTWIVDQLSADQREALIRDWEVENKRGTGAYTWKLYGERLAGIGLAPTEDQVSLFDSSGAISQLEVDRAKFLRVAADVPPPSLPSATTPTPTPTPLEEAMQFLGGQLEDWSSVVKTSAAQGSQLSASASRQLWLWIILGGALIYWFSFRRR